MKLDAFSALLLYTFKTSTELDFIKSDKSIYYFQSKVTDKNVDLLIELGSKGFTVGFINITISQDFMFGIEDSQVEVMIDYEKALGVLLDFAINGLVKDISVREAKKSLDACLGCNNYDLTWSVTAEYVDKHKSRATDYPVDLNRYYYRAFDGLRFRYWLLDLSYEESCEFSLDALLRCLNATNEVEEFHGSKDVKKCVFFRDKDVNNNMRRLKYVKTNWAGYELYAFDSRDIG